MCRGYTLPADRRPKKKNTPHPLARTRSRKSTRVIASRSHGCMSQKSLHSTPAFTLRNVLEISTLHPLVQGLNERLSPANARTLTRAVPETRTRTLWHPAHANKSLRARTLWLTTLFRIILNKSKKWKLFQKMEKIVVHTTIQLWHIICAQSYSHVAVYSRACISSNVGNFGSP